MKKKKQNGVKHTSFDMSFNKEDVVVVFFMALFETNANK